MISFLVLVLKGMGYGITHIVPGLGGGLILILMGIYEQFVDALGNILVRRDKWKEYLAFLIPLGIGMVLGMIGLAKIITVVMDRWPVATMFFFMGLLVGTIPPVLRMHGDMRPTVGRVVALVIGLAVVVATRLLEEEKGLALDLSSPGGALYNLLVCFLAGGASVTPGLDGSYVLLIGGTYRLIIQAISQLTHLQIAWAALITTGVGAVAGIMVFSKLIDTALKRAPSVSYYAVIGLIAGSVYGLWPADAGSANILISVVAFAVGVVIALLFGREPAATAAGDSAATTP